jgi:hypothetical protein
MLIEHVVAPADTDSNIDDWLEDHYAYIDTRIAPRGLLLVHLPGSYGIPSNNLLYLKEMASQGLHVIGLRYPNRWEVRQLCADATDLNCFENVRLEIIEGQDLSPLVSITPANSIINRLVKLLMYLDQNYPSEGWGQYLNGDQLNWSMIIFSGHSQGSGHAEVIGKYYSVYRVIMYGPPVDANPNGIAPWQNTNNITPAARYYGFNHDQDSWPAKQVLWTMLGLDAFGQPIDVDVTTPPYSDSHELHTNALPATGSMDDAHGSVITDKDTPLLPDGTPLFAPVWRYLCCS